MGFKLKFWGVRGSIACPSPKHISYGGNTSCIEVACGGRRIILDAGTGLRGLGQWLMKKKTSRATILMSHTHSDHIGGFPYFQPAYHPNHEFTIMAGHLKNMGGVRNVFAGEMAQPTFPVPLTALKAQMVFEDFEAGDSFNVDGNIKVKTARLNHPGGATGYRIEYAGKALCYVTDTEHVPGIPDQNILALIEGADYVVYDSTYSDAEFRTKMGWGHSTWEEGMRLGLMANAKSVVIFHHDPDHEDRFMDEVETKARGLWAEMIVAREHMRLTLA